MSYTVVTCVIDEFRYLLWSVLCQGNKSIEKQTKLDL